MKWLQGEKGGGLPLGVVHKLRENVLVVFSLESDRLTWSDPLRNSNNKRLSEHV